MSERALLPGLATRHPIGSQLPGLYAEDEFTQRFTAGLDEVLAPILCTLDNLAGYFAPPLAPADFLALLAHWTGAPVARPEAVAAAVRLHAVRGTRAGLAAVVRQVYGVEPEIEENGGAAWSAVSGAALPGAAAPALLVRLRVADPRAVDQAALAALVAANCPAHLPVRVEVTASAAAGPGPTAGTEGESW
ncbi:phage tail protein [Kitasatospora sp. NPDC097643]|uniref:phage tail protein n=1 Tax=Kitasatospora sp. NPDC097643 TaxID=3157230 RepID=UPI003330DAB2